MVAAWRSRRRVGPRASAGAGVDGDVRDAGRAAPRAHHAIGRKIASARRGPIRTLPAPRGGSREARVDRSRWLVEALNGRRGGALQDPSRRPRQARALPHPAESRLGMTRPLPRASRPSSAATRASRPAADPASSSGYRCYPQVRAPRSAADPGRPARFGVRTRGGGVDHHRPRRASSPAITGQRRLAAPSAR